MGQVFTTGVGASTLPKGRYLLIMVGGRYLRYGQYKGIWTICPDSPIVSLRAIACIAATKKDKRKGRRTNVCAGFVRERLCIPFLKIYPPTYTSKTYHFSHFKAILHTIPHSFHHSGYDSTYQFRYTKKKRRTMADSIYYIALTETDSKKEKKKKGLSLYVNVNVNVNVG